MSRLLDIVTTSDERIAGQGGWTRLVGLLVVLVASLSLVSMIQERMNDVRRDHNLTDDAVLENAPPGLAVVVVALGGFRGLVADALFLRLQRMQEQERYFELVQLARWLVQLQPRMTGATSFLAWNMAYNISVTFSDPRDRWRWVQRGLELIRDQALDLNPDDPVLHKELGWIYQHKMGQGLDDANKYYKIQLALQMMEVLGKDSDVDWERLAQAPQSEEALLQMLGDRAASVKRILLEKNFTLPQLEYEFRSRGELPPVVRDAFATIRLEDITHTPGAAIATDVRQLIVLFMRARWLVNEKKLDPVRIRDIVRKRGPLDFRVPESHAVYWATRGLERAEGQVNIDCERMIFQSMANAFKSGRIVFLPSWEEQKEYMPDAAYEQERLAPPIFVPNLEVADGVRDAYLSAATNNPDNKSINSGYENWLVDAIVTLFIYGNSKKASEYLDDLRALRPGHRQYAVDVESMVLRELAKDIAGMTEEQATGIVFYYLMRHFRAIAFAEHTNAINFQKIARHIHQTYHADIEGAREHMRRSLAPFPEMKRQALAMSRRSFPPIVTRRLDFELRQLTDGLGGNESSSTKAERNLLNEDGRLPVQRN